MSNIVAIVGRPNVGKSTLFNRLTESRDAIVDDVAGVTRDRHYGIVEWIDKKFTVIDTGGYVNNSEDTFEAAIREQVSIAIQEASLILFMVDTTTGVTNYDDAIAEILRRANKKVLVVANKTDNVPQLPETSVFYGLGLGEVYPISSQTGGGTGELLDEVVKYIEPEEEDESNIPKIAFIGRPNVGKSSIINALIGEDRTIVTPLAGTTRDALEIPFNKFGFEYKLVDTAGLRKKSKVTENIEFYSVLRTIKAIEQADVCVLMLDATAGIEAQDLNIFHLIERNKKSVIILVNKWDLVEKDHKTSVSFEKSIKEKISPFVDVPILFISVQEKQRVLKHKKVPTSKLNEVLLPIIEHYPPPSIKGKYVKIKYITQLKTQSPTFVFFCNLPQYIKESYRRFLENKIREHFDFQGNVINLFFRQK
jgi:GTPase